MADYSLPVTSANFYIFFEDISFTGRRISFNDPLLSIINKIKIDSTVQTLLPSYHNVFSGFMPDTPTTPGIYVSEIIEDFEPVMGFQQSKNRVLLSDNSKWQLDSLHNLSVEHAYDLGLVACRSLLPSIVDAGLFNIKYTFDDSFIDENYVPKVYRAVFTITCTSRHKII